MIQEARSTVWEDLNAQETFERKLLHVEVAFDQMIGYQRDIFLELFCAGTELRKSPDSEFWTSLSSRVDKLKKSIERDSRIKMAQPITPLADARHYSEQELLTMNQVLSVA